jgi:hypothetical protein
MCIPRMLVLQPGSPLNAHDTNTSDSTTTPEASGGSLQLSEAHKKDW